ncbi:MAG: hypothetical protein J6L89_03305 [Clostridia bacterium]|nr:hypothetical protein [Clostridia bacterium]
MEIHTSDNHEFLNKIYQNAQMGSNSITYVSEKTEDKELLTELQAQLAEYNEIASEAAKALLENNDIPKEKGPLAQVGLWSSVQMNTLVDKSSSHIAEMMMQGNSMGVIDMSKALRKYKTADNSTVKLGEKLIKTEEENFQRMKPFLQ